MNGIPATARDLTELRAMATLFDQLPGVMCGVKDLNSRYLLVSKNTSLLFGYTDPDEVVGMDDRAMQCPAAEFADLFREQDDYVISQNTTLPILDILTHADDQQRVLLTQKAPFHLHGKLIGSIGQCTQISASKAQRLAGLLRDSERRYTRRQQDSHSYTIGCSPKSVGLGRRELDCVFYLLRGKTMRETASILGISWRTVEHYLNNVKKKWDCTNRGMLIECAINRGMLSYLPPTVVLHDLSHSFIEG